jgi:hypothetical protein
VRWWPEVVPCLVIAGSIERSEKERILGAVQNQLDEAGQRYTGK